MTTPAAVGTLAAGRRSGRRRRNPRRWALGYALLAPSMIGVGLFLIVPAVVAVVISFESWNIISPPSWLGLGNYVTIFTDPVIWHSLLVTVRYVAIVIPSQTILGMLMALLLNRKLPGSAVFRVIFAMPWICAPLTLGVVWRWIFAPTGGALNAIIGHQIAWMSDLRLAPLVVCAVSVWQQTGYVTLFYLAGLTGVPADLQDAARVDGAGEWQVFWRITLPLLRSTTFFIVATGIISSFQVFDTVYALTQGGAGTTAGGPGVPGENDVIAVHIYDLAFNQLNLGEAAALSVVLLVVLVVATLAQQLYFRRRITYDVTG